MTNNKKNSGGRPPVDRLLHKLQERAKELRCLYKVDEALAKTKAPLEKVCMDIIAAIPPGWQYPEHCVAQITIDNRTYKGPQFVVTEWGLAADIIASGVSYGRISVYYTEEMPRWDDGPFLAEETKLIQTIADRIAIRISQHRCLPSL